MNQENKSSFAKVITIIGFSVVVCSIVLALIWKTGFLLPRTIVKISSIPPGALVLVDGNPSGVTPLTIEGIAPGEHSFRFEMKGYRKKGISKVCFGDVEIKEQLKAIPYGMLSVECNPDNTTVFIDGIRKGRTPLVIRLLPGRHTVSLVKENYDESLRDVEIEAEKTKTLALTLVSSTENYYLKEIAADPEDLINYCDLMRYYYVKGRYEDLSVLIFKGFDSYNKRKSGDGPKRFIQEIVKVRTESTFLYEKKIYPLLVPLLVEYCKKTANCKGVIEALVLNLKGKKSNDINISRLLDLIRDYPEVKGFRLYLTDRTSKAYNGIRKLSSENFSRVGKVILEADKYIEDAETLFSINYSFAIMARGKHLYDLGEKAARKAIDNFPPGGKKNRLFIAYNELLVNLRYLKKYDEGERVARALLADKGLTSYYRSLISLELKRIEKLRKKGRKRR